MEAVYYAVRANLRRLMRLHPQWTQPQYAQAVGMSVGWVKKWKKRLQEAEPEDEQVLHSRSRARTHPPERISQVVVDRLLQMRDEPPEGLRRTPGPKALLYYLPRDAQLEGERLPRSSRTVYRILQQAGRIAVRQPHVHEPLERPAPMSHWQLDAEGCQHGARRSLWQAATCGRSAECWWTRAPRCWWMRRCGLTFRPRPPWLRWPTCSCGKGCLRRCAWIAMDALSVVPVAATFLPPWCASASVWASTYGCATRITHSKMALSSATIGPDLAGMSGGGPSWHPGRGARGHRGLCTVLQHAASASRTQLRQSPATRGLCDLTRVACGA
jgi:hypothetical protein